MYFIVFILGRGSRFGFSSSITFVVFFAITFENRGRSTPSLRPDTTDYATVRVIGVSDTKSREQLWHALVTIAFTVTPDAIVTDVGAVALANGTVKVCDNTWVRVQHALPPQGTYDIMPSTLIVATYWPAPTSEKPTNENAGANTGDWSSHAGEQSLCEMFTWTKYGDATLPAARVAEMFAEFCLQPFIIK